MPFEAGAVARQACQAAPDWEWPHRLLAISEGDRGRHRQALRAAGEAARLSPWTLETKNVLALAQVGAGERAAAEQTAASCVAEHPQAPLAHETVARVAWSSGRLDLAEAAARRALEQDPLDDGLQALLAELVAARGRSHEANALRVEAVRSSPRNAEHRRNLSKGLGAAAVVTFGAAKVGTGAQALSGIVALQGLRGASQKLGAEAALVLGLGCLALHSIVSVVWLARMRRRQVARAALPAGFWEGLRPERHFGDLGLLKLTGTLTATMAVLGAVVGAWAVAAPLALIALGEIAAVVIRRRQLTARYGMTVDRLFMPLLRLGVDRLRHRLMDRPSLEGLAASGRPTLEERERGAYGPLWAGLAALICAAITSSWWAALAVLLLVAGVHGIGVDRWPAPLVRGGSRAVVGLESGEPLDAGTAALRGVLRTVLLPLILIEYRIFKRSSRRCLHDKLCGTIVLRLNSAFDRPQMAVG